VEVSDGPRPLSARQYYARLTQAMVTALTAPMADGRLYEVDMRLRPSGRQGPVATSVDSFASYQLEEAWTWEHLALTRARVLAGPADLAEEVEALRRRVLAERGGLPRVRSDVAEMRVRLAEAKPGLAPLEAKAGPGKMMDVELLAQMQALLSASPARRVEAQLAAGGERAPKLSQTDQTELLAAYRLCWLLQAASRLLADDAIKPESLGQGARAFVLRETGAANLDALTQDMAARAGRAAAVIGRLLAKGD
jgi:glutamate-ammonia-ligase adenylyltransferase